MEDYTRKGFWLGTFGPYTPNPTPVGSVRADVAIIGGGFTGLAAAYFIKKAEPSLKVVVLEGEVVGFGASGRNGGFSMTLFGLTMGITAFRFGKDAARQAQHYMERAVDLVDELVKEHGIECEYEYTGFLRVATTPKYARRIQEELALARSLGIEGVEWIDEAQLREQVRSPAYLGAWWEPRCAILNPAKLVRGMKGVAQKVGAVVYENAPVDQVSREGKGFRLRTASGEVEADKVVLATNAYSARFPQLRAAQMPIHTHIVLTEPLTPEQRSEIGWQNRQGIEDARNFVHYYRLTKENRLLMGGERVQYYFDNGTRQDAHAPTFRRLEEHIRKIHPVLKGIRITHRWGGPVSGNIDFAPNMGYLGKDKNAVFSIGCMGHGVSMTHLNGWTIADLILEKRTERTEVFFVNRSYIPFPDEPLRSVGVNLVLNLMKAEDSLDEREGLGARP